MTKLKTSNLDIVRNTKNDNKKKTIIRKFILLISFKDRPPLTFDKERKERRRINTERKIENGQLPLHCLFISFSNYPSGYWLPPAVAPGAYPGVGVRREGGAGPAHSQGAGGADESPPVQEGEGQVAAGADH